MKNVLKMLVLLALNTRACLAFVQRIENLVYIMQEVCRVAWVYLAFLSQGILVARSLKLIKRKVKICASWLWLPLLDALGATGCVLVLASRSEELSEAQVLCCGLARAFWGLQRLKDVVAVSPDSFLG